MQGRICEGALGPLVVTRDETGNFYLRLCSNTPAKRTTIRARQYFFVQQNFSFIFEILHLLYLQQSQPSQEDQAIQWNPLKKYIKNYQSLFSWKFVTHWMRYFFIFLFFYFFEYLAYPQWKILSKTSSKKVNVSIILFSYVLSSLQRKHKRKCWSDRMQKQKGVEASCSTMLLYLLCNAFIYPNLR